MLKVKFTLILSLLITVYCNLYSQVNKNTIDFRHLTIEEGLPSNIIRGITQDTEGFMWFATTDGLVRHDGYSMKIFRGDTPKNQLKDSYIYDVYCDSKGRIWVGTNSHGLFKYNPIDESFLKIEFHYTDSLNINLNRIRKIKEDVNGNLWLCTQSNGLIKYNFETQEEQIFRHDENNNNSVPSNQVCDVDFDSLNNLWISTSDKGISYFDQINYKFTNYSQNPNIKYSIPSNVTLSVHSDKDIAIIGSNSGTFMFNKDSERFYLMTKKSARNILKTRNGDFYFCTDKGIVIIKKKGRRHSLAFNSSQPNGLSSDDATCAYEDKSGVIWIGTRGGGINVYYPKQKNFETYSFDPNLKYSLSSNIIRGFSEDKDHNIWISTLNNGIDVYDIKKEKFFNLKNVGYNGIHFKDNSTLKIFHDKFNNFWAGTYGNGVFMLPSGKKEAINFLNDPDNENSIQNNIVQEIFEDSQGNIWLGTESGFDIYSPKRKEFRHFKHGSSNSITPLAIQSNCIQEDKFGNFWVGTYGGLNYLKREHTSEDIFEDNFNITNITDQSANNTRLSENRIISMFYDASVYSNKVMLGTYGGGLHVIQFDSTKIEMIKSYTTLYGMSNNVVYGILADVSGNLWMSTNNGLTKFDAKLYKFQTYGINDGLQGHQYYWGASFRSSDGYLYFGGIKGFNRFISDSISDDAYLPRIAFTDFRIFNKSIRPGDTINGKVLLQKSINHLDEIILSRKENMFSIEFAGLHYAYPQDNIYRYMLEGFDSDYIDVKSDQRLITFTNLDPGTYILKVKGANFDGQWNDDVRTLQIHILPPLHQKTWFRISVLVLIALFIVLYFYVRMASVNRQKKLLKRLVNEKTKRLNSTNKKLKTQANELNKKNQLLTDKQAKVEEQAQELHLQAKILQNTNEELLQSNAAKDKFFSIVSHDLRNPFNYIMGSAEILFKRYDGLSDEKKIGYSKKIYNSTKNTFRLLENLLSWSRTQSKQIKPQFIPLMIFDVIDQNLVVVEEKIKQKEITFIQEIDQTLMIHADINMINLVVQNLLTNAVKFTPRKGEIKIIAEKDHELVFLHIVDNGVGMSKKKINDLFRIDRSVSSEGTEGESGTGLGLILTHEFVVANEGTISIESTPKMGTTVSVAFPCAKLN